MCRFRPQRHQFRESIALECLKASGTSPAACLFGDPRPADPGVCLATGGWSSARTCCPPTALSCPGPGFSLLDLEGRPLLSRPAEELGLRPEGGFGLAGRLLGDLDRDGVPDLAIAAPLADPDGVEDAGSVLILSGASGEPLGRLDGRAPGGRFGTSLAVSGGRLRIGAPGAGDRVEGGVFFYSADGREPLGALEGPAPGSAFGSTLLEEPGGDGAGSGRLLVGAPGWYPETERPGRVLVLSEDGKPVAELQSEAIGDGFGLSLAWTADLDGDGRHDVAVGAPYAGSDRAKESGRVLLYSSSGKLLRVLNGTTEGGHFGASLSSGGDVDEDGRPDLLIGAPHALAGESLPAGNAVLCSADGARIAQLDGESEGDLFGEQVLAPGDLDGDGLSDLLIGAPGARFDDAVGTSSLFLGRPPEAPGPSGWRGLLGRWQGD
jgi:hypothetical protein